MQARFTWGIVVSAGAALTLALLSSAQADPKLAINHQGVERLATLHRPQAIASVPSPLVVALHGLGQSVESLQEWLHLDAASDREKFSVVYPEAIGRKWSYGRPIDGPMPTVNGKTVDDVGYIRNLIDGLVTMKIADPERIYVTGMSRGGLMTFTLVCALSNKIAAAAPLITGMTDHQREDCRPARPVPLLVVAGTNDESQWYDGYIAPQGRLLSVPETMEYWRARNGCTKETATSLPHRDVNDPTRIRMIEWTNCRNDAQLKLYRVNDGGHRLPTFSPSNEQTDKTFGAVNHDVETADEIAGFVKTVKISSLRR
ncbi:MAG TPA: PHB depolymerase family esterase [Xanthobacteraceae bacterium]|nr:PHB depolymerase family esterase [Xanthobacteraceae bacterium]